MISRTHRFRGRKRINEVYRSGRSARGPLFNTRVLKNAGGDFRVAVVVSKKVAKSAVVRNRIRRKIYTCFNAEELNSLGGADIIINVFSADAAQVPQADLIKQLQRQLSI